MAGLRLSKRFSASHLRRSRQNLQKQREGSNAWYEPRLRDAKEGQIDHLTPKSERLINTTALPRAGITDFYITMKKLMNSIVLLSLVKI